MNLDAQTGFGPCLLLRVKWHQPSFILALLVGILIAAALPSDVNAQKTPAAPQALPATTVILNSEKDSYVDESLPDDNFNSDDEAHTKRKAGDDEFAFYYFDISGISPSDTLISAILNLWVTDEANVNHQIHRVPNAWDENTITWNTDGANWTGGPWASFTPDIRDAYVSIDVTTLVRSWHKGTHPNHGFKINSSGNDVHGKFSSREWADSGQRPYLEITIAPFVTPLGSDLVISKTVDRPTVAPGETVTYTIIVVNDGPDPATSIQVKDKLPSGVTYVGYWATQGNYVPGTGIWNLGSLANAAADTLHITVKID